MKARLLVIDDEPAIRDTMRMILEYEGYDVLLAGSGQEGLAMVERESPDLVFLDIKMPGLDGIEAARRILARQPIPVVMLTAYGNEELIARAVRAGVFAYLVKPYRPQDLRPTIEAARARHADLLARVPFGAGELDSYEGADYYLSGYGYVA